MNKIIEQNKLLNDQEKKEGLSRLKSNPIRISMNLTGNCNIRCTYCHLNFANYYSKYEIDLNQFMKLETFLKSVKHIVYFSSTEPLFAKHFKEIFEWTNQFDAEKYFSTNGILMDKEISELIVKGNLHFLTISFAGITKEMFEKYHGVDKLDTVIDNIKILNQVKKDNNSVYPKVRLVFVLTYENKEELNGIIRLAKELDCSEGVKITYLKAYAPELVNITPYKHRDIIGKYVKEAQALANDLEVKVEFDGDDFNDLDFEKKTQYHKKCYEPFERFHIEADGNVRPCVSLSCSDFAGNINDQTVEEIWNSPVYVDFRNRVNSSNPPDACKRCTHNFHKDFKRKDIWDLSDMDLSIYNRRNKIKK
ncbi:MAG: radical SAM protein [Arcobacteraceae bacterium]|nr:radical SAM protein [Arcobacteraceae bacterium]